MYQSMGFTSSYIVLGGIALCFTLISFITLDKARVFFTTGARELMSGGSVYVSFILWRGVLR